MELVQIENSYESVKPKILEQYKKAKAPNLNAFLKALGALKDDLEGAIFSVLNGFDLDTAVGAQLDLLGLLFNVERLGRSDTDYRLAIKQIASLRQFATPEDIISVLKVAYGATYAHYYPNYPASFLVYTDASIDNTTLNSLAPAGVQGFLGAHLQDTDLENLNLMDGDTIAVVE